MFPLQLSQFCTDTEEAKSSGVSNLCIGKPPGSFRPAAHQKAVTFPQYASKLETQQLLPSHCLLQQTFCILLAYTAQIRC